MRRATLVYTLLVASAYAWMPQDRFLPAFQRLYDPLGSQVPYRPSKIRGVNLGGWLISEPWLMQQEWTGNMGCLGCYSCNNVGGHCSEFDCVSALGQAQADIKFNQHYARWITPDDIQQIYDAGLNTIRIPIGYWSLRELVDASEHFPNMDLKYLDAVVQKAADLGMFIVMDLHAAPGGQKVKDAFTGQCLGREWLPGFFTQSNYNRATRWLTWMTYRIHTNLSYRKTVGIIGVVNEPQTDKDDGGIPQQERDTLTQLYYPQALKAVRDVETCLCVPPSQRLHVQYMDSLWGAGNPKSNLSADTRIIFDDHNYVGGAVAASYHPSDPQNVKKSDYMRYTCYKDNRLSDGDTPKIVQEFSLTIDPSVEGNTEFAWSTNQNHYFYKQWWIAQQRLYEQTSGWIFWTWKIQLDNPRWSYQRGLQEGWIPRTVAGLESARKYDVCNEYFGTTDGRS